MTEATTTVHAHCHCNTFNLTLEYTNSTLPHPRFLCLCTSCRKLSGTSGGISYIPLPATLQESPPSTDSLTPYKTSDRLTRYFCPTCGAHTLVYIHPLKKWSIATGLLDRTEGIVDWRGSKFVKATIDGGVSEWIGKTKFLEQENIEGGEIHEGDQEWSKEQKEMIPKGQESLNATCHCEGIKLRITRPTLESRKAKSGFPDLMIPYNLHDPVSENLNNEPWFLRCNETKYLAGTCTCTSCRLNLGFEIQTWAFIPRINIIYESTKTLKQYESKKDVVRSFCGTCGATVFWEGKWRWDIVDVSTGLFDPEQGARTEDWLDWWTERVSFEEDAVSRELVDRLGEGMRRWGEKKAG